MMVIREKINIESIIGHVRSEIS